jgi:hypothetical protein
MANEINNLQSSEASPNTVLADLIDLVVISHRNTVKTLEAFNALHRAARDLDARFEERYAEYLASGKTEPIVRGLTEIPAPLVESLVAAADVLRRNQGSK